MQTLRQALASAPMRPRASLPIVAALALTVLVAGCTGSSSASAGKAGGSGATTTGPTSTGAPSSTPSAAAPTTASGSGDQGSVLKTLPGSSSSKCVAVGSRRDVRSGSLAAGNFAQARTQYRTIKNQELPTVSLYVIPQSSKTMPTLKVKVTTASGSSTTVTSTSVGDADKWRYYNVQVPVAKPGTYHLHASAGANHGCFTVVFTG